MTAHEAPAKAGYLVGIAKAQEVLELKRRIRALRANGKSGETIAAELQLPSKYVFAVLDDSPSLQGKQARIRLRLLNSKVHCVDRLLTISHDLRAARSRLVRKPTPELRGKVRDLADLRVQAIEDLANIERMLGEPAKPAAEPKRPARRQAGGPSGVPLPSFSVPAEDSGPDPDIPLED